MKFLLNCYKSSISKFNTMCDEIKVLRIKKNDSDFIEEYCTAMEPLAISLDILQVWFIMLRKLCNLKINNSNCKNKFITKYYHFLCMII